MILSWRTLALLTHVSATAKCFFPKRVLTVRNISDSGEEGDGGLERDLSPPGLCLTGLTNVDLIIRLCITYALELELLQGLGELLDGSGEIWKIRWYEDQMSLSTN